MHGDDGNDAIYGAADSDGDGIRNDWLVNGKPAPAPTKPKVKTVTAKTITVDLPKTPAGGKLTVYVRTGKGEFVKAIGKVNSRGELTIKGLKRNTGYEIKVVAVKAGKQSAASKPVKVKTRRT